MHSDASRFIERITGGKPDRAVLDGLLGKPEGALIGDFKLVQRMGEGGFAEVFEAQQMRPVQRRVALKLIKTKRMSDVGIARFEAERQALAIMDHPNIAKVFEGGATEEGQPFFAMELVEGASMTRFCRERELGVRERVALLVKVCDALRHAHRRGVIHRDIKPSNVLVSEVDGEAQPKVIDFGIARMVGETGSLAASTTLTGEHQLLGTLAYMSPEQMDGGRDVDTSTDVYGLGVLAHEVLTGTIPFEVSEGLPSDVVKAMAEIREREPARPSRRVESSATSRELSGDLDWIVLKALEKDPARRYESAGAMAADLRAYLEDRPVEAGAPGKIYRARKFVRRHRIAMTAAAAISASLVAGTVVSVNQAIKAQRAEREAVASAEAAQEFSDFVYGGIFATDEYTDMATELHWSEGLLQRAVQLAESRGDSSPELVARVVWRRAMLHESWDDPERAEELLLEELTKLKASMPPGDPGLEVFVRQVWDFFVRHEKYEEAAELASEQLSASPGNEDLRYMMEHAILLRTCHVAMADGSTPECPPWQWVVERPGEDWSVSSEGDLSEAGWVQGWPPFGSEYNGFGVRTAWETEDLWCRGRFELERAPAGGLFVRALHDDGLEVFINGVPAVAKTGTSGGEYQFYRVGSEARDTLRAGANDIAIHCRNNEDIGVLDAGVFVETRATAVAMIEAFGRLHTDDPEIPHWREGALPWIASLKRFGPVEEKGLSSLMRTLRRPGDAEEDRVAEAVWPPERVVELLSAGEEWQFCHEPGLAKAGWQSLDRLSWTKAAAPFGFGESSVTTEIERGVTACAFRTSFQIEDPELIDYLKVRVRYDDGLATYVNGREVFCWNLDSGAGLDKLANSAMGEPEESRYRVAVVSAKMLKKGANTIAVQVHQGQTTSSDFYFDLALEALLAEQDPRRRRPASIPTVRAESAAADGSGTATPPKP